MYIKEIRVMHSDLQTLTVSHVDRSRVKFKSDLCRIMKSDAWLKSSDINIYMELLSASVSCRVKFFDASWFGHCLLYHSNPMYFKCHIVKPDC